MSFTVIIAVTGHMLFDRTGIPESIFMLIFGLVLGPVTGIIEVQDIMGISVHVFTLSIVIILLESSLTTNIQEAIETMRTSTIFSILVLIVTSMFCGSFLKYILGWPSSASILLGIICSGTSTLPIMYFTSRMRISPAVNQMLIFESIINDVTIITAVSLIIQAISFNLTPMMTILRVSKYLIVALVLGGISSVIWTFILARLSEGFTLKYLTTLAISVILYFLSESQGGSGVMAVMIFGITIGNLPDLLKDNRPIRRKVMNFFSEIEVMQDEVTFLVKNTFFFLLGLMFDLDSVSSHIVQVAIALTILMISSRWISYRIIGFIDERYDNYVMIVSLMVSRGLTAGLTAIMPTQKGLQMPPITDIVVVMILLTNLAATVGFTIFTRKNTPL